MSGHSKWSQIKRQKGVNDSKRGQAFTRLGREIAMAAREGGGDPDANFQLRLAVQILYEGYGPGGAAVIIQVMTDNRVRTVSEVRNVLHKNGGRLGESGAVAWQFDDRGVITVAVNGHDPDEIELLAIDAGAVDVLRDEDQLEIQTELADFDLVRQALERQKLEIVNAERAMIAKTTVALDSKHTLQMLKLVDKLEELDDVQKVYSNVELSEEDIAAYAG